MYLKAGRRLVDPFTLAVAAPVTAGVQLVHLQYRTDIGVEFALQ